MTVESVTYISDLNSGYPAAGDAKNEGDDHIRNIKAAIKASFPNVSGAVTPTHTELNYVDGVTSAIQTQLNQLKPTWTTLSTSPQTLSSGGWYLVRTNSIAITCNLPAGATGSIVRIKDADANAATNNITITPDGTEVIEDQAGGATLVVNIDAALVTLQYLNSAWRLI